MHTTLDRPGGRRSAMLLLGAAVLLAAAARLVFCLEIVGFHAPLRGDEIDYHALASSIAAGDGFAGAGGEATAARPPLWPLVLAGVYRLAGPSPEAGRALAIIIGTLVVPLVYAAAKGAFPKRPAVPAVAALLAAVNPTLIFMSSYLLAENLSIVLMLLAVTVVSAGVSGERGLRSYLAAGALLGLGSLARPPLFPVALFMAAWAVIAGAGVFRRRLARAAVLGAGLAAALAPWAVRNEARLGSPVLFTTHGGMTFYQGNNPSVRDEPSYRGGVAPLEALPGWKGVLAKEGEVERDREAWRLAREFVAGNLSSVPRMALWKFVRFWRFGGDMGLSGVRSGWWWDKGSRLGALASSLDVFFLHSIVVIPLFIAGLAFALRETRRLANLHAIVIVHTATALFFYGSLRSRAPVEPVIAIFAAYAIVRLLALAARRRVAGDFAR